MPGRIVGRHRPDHRLEFYDLQCDQCRATWVGPDNEECWWCRRREEIGRRHQAVLVLKRPDVDDDDASYEARMTGWAQRLAVAVRAGIITEQQARRALG